MCHLLESLPEGDFDRMPQCIVSWDSIENISNAHQVFLFTGASKKLRICSKCTENHTF